MAISQKLRKCTYLLTTREAAWYRPLYFRSVIR